VKEIKEKKKKEKKNESEVLPNRNCDQSLHRSLLGVLRAIVG